MLMTSNDFHAVGTDRGLERAASRAPHASALRVDIDLAILFRDKGLAILKAFQARVRSPAEASVRGTTGDAEQAYEVIACCEAPQLQSAAIQPSTASTVSGRP